MAVFFADCQPAWFDIPAHSTLQDAYLPEVFVGTTAQGDGTFIVDEIPLQVITTANEGLVFYMECNDGTTFVDLTSAITTIQINSTMKCYTIFQDNQHPYFSTHVGKLWRWNIDDGTTEWKSNWFALTDCTEVLTDTAVIRYSNSTNINGYNTLFVNSGTPITFTWRVPAGLKPQGFAPLLDSDEFRNQRQESVSLYSLAYSKYVLTLGRAEGVPYFYADLLNKIFSLDSVELYDPDADTWREVRRSGNAVPQLAETYSGSGMFHITLEIELVQPQITL